MICRPKENAIFQVLKVLKYKAFSSTVSVSQLAFLNLLMPF